MPAPTSISDIDLTPITGKTYFNTDREWREEFIYFLMVDRFQDDVVRPVATGSARSAGVATPNSFYGGTIKGVTRNLDYIAGLGCTAIWLSPVFENNPGAYHGYNIGNYLAIDPHFGTKQDLLDLVEAAHSFESANGYFPSGMDKEMIGPLVYILPYIEQDAWFRKWTFNAYDVSTNIAGHSIYYRDPNNQPQSSSYPDGYPAGLSFPVEAKSIGTFTCPAAVNQGIDDQASVLRWFAGGQAGRDWPNPTAPADATSFAAYTGSFLVGNLHKMYGRTNYLAMAGNRETRADELTDLNSGNATQVAMVAAKGVFSFNSKERIVNIQDGSSNTIGFMESAGGYVNFAAPNNGWGGNAYSMGVTYTTFGMCPDKTNQNCDYTNSGGLSWGLPGSNHTGNLIQTVFCDGSVRSVKPDMPYSLFVFLGGMSDGAAVTIDQ